MSVLGLVMWHLKLAELKQTNYETFKDYIELISFGFIDREERQKHSCIAA